MVSLVLIVAKICKRGSHIQGHAVTVIRQLIVTTFGFKRGTDARSKAFNCNLVIKLKTSAAFHYKVWLFFYPDNFLMTGIGCRCTSWIYAGKNN